MASLSVIVLALVPVAFVILLGVIAGRFGVISPDRSPVLASLALDFCLPALLFAATAVMTMKELENWQFFLVIAIGLLSIYVVTLGLSLTAFRETTSASSLQALNSAFPNMAFMGVPVLTAVIGKSAVLSVVIGNLVSSFVLLPMTLTLLEAGKARTQSKEGGKPGDAAGMAIVWQSFFGACKQPLVWAPLVGVVIAVLQLPMPEVATKSLNLIGTATSGVALFALGSCAQWAEIAGGRGRNFQHQLQAAGATGNHAAARLASRRDRSLPVRNDPARRAANSLDDGHVRRAI